MDPRVLALLDSLNNDRSWRAVETGGQDFGFWRLEAEPAWYRLSSLPQDVGLELSW